MASGRTKPAIFPQTLLIWLQYHSSSSRGYIHSVLTFHSGNSTTNHRHIQHKSLCHSLLTHDLHRHSILPIRRDPIRSHDATPQRGATLKISPNIPKSSEYTRVDSRVCAVSLEDCSWYTDTRVYVYVGVVQASDGGGCIYIFSLD